MAPPLTEVTDIQLQMLVYRPKRDEMLSWPGLRRPTFADHVYIGDYDGDVSK